MYIVVEIDPATGDRHVLYPRHTMAQVHTSLESAERHREWYIDHVYVEDPESGRQAVSIYALAPPLQPSTDGNLAITVQ